MMNRYFFIVPIFFMGCVSNIGLQCDETYNDYYCPNERMTFNLGNGGYYPSPTYVPYTPSYFYNPYFNPNNCNPHQHHNNNQQTENRPIVTGPRPTILSPHNHKPKSDN